MKPENQSRCNTQINEIKKTHLMYIKQQVDILNAFKEKYGEEAISIAKTAFCKNTFEAYLPLFKSIENRSVESLIALLWEPLREKGFEFIVSKNDDSIQINCTKCPWAMLYATAGSTDWGFNLVCEADSKFVEIFNKDIHFKRTKTLMRGDECCNHQYSMSYT